MRVCLKDIVLGSLCVRRAVLARIELVRAYNDSVGSPQRHGLYNPSTFKTVASIQNRAQTLLNSVNSSTTDQALLIRMEEFTEHLLRFPACKRQVLRTNGIATMLKIRDSCRHKEIRGEAQKALALLGWVEPIKGRGIKILSIDGGGSRGLVAIEILKRIKELSKTNLIDMFDLVIGSSTGAILCFMLAVNGSTLEECTETYVRIAKELFQRNTVLGTGKLFLNHAFYETEQLERILKDVLGTNRLIDTVADLKTPKIIAVSTRVNHTVLHPFLFRNYCHAYGVESRYPGGCHYTLWEALRASTAAPGYFEECKLGQDIFQDGGLLTNNPTAVAIHEAKLLWPEEPLQCVVSLGTGWYRGRGGLHSTNFSSFKEKLLKVVASATDTEDVDTILSDLLPPKVYYRCNPYMSADVPLDECRQEVMEQLQVDAQSYMMKNSTKIQSAVQQLTDKKTLYSKIKDKFRLSHAKNQEIHV